MYPWISASNLGKLGKCSLAASETTRLVLLRHCITVLVLFMNWPPFHDCSGVDISGHRFFMLPSPRTSAGSRCLAKQPIRMQPCLVLPPWDPWTGIGPAVCPAVSPASSVSNKHLSMRGIHGPPPIQPRPPPAAEYGMTALCCTVSE